MALSSLRALSLSLLLVAPACLALSACKVPDAKPVPAPAEAAGTQWMNDGVVLYMPDKVMKERIRVEDMAPYMKALDLASQRVIEAHPGQAGTSGMLLVAMRPGGLSKAWVTTGEPPMTAPVSEALMAAAEAVPVPPVTTDTVLVGIKFHAFGGGQEPVSAGPPIPRDWYSHFSKDGGVLDDAMMEKVWPK